MKSPARFFASGSKPAASVRVALACAATAFFTIGCNMLDEKKIPVASDLKADLETISRARIFFGHQSVGRDLLDGLEVLAGQQGVALRLVEGAPQDTLPGLFHTKVGQNRNPQSKCEAFGKFLAENPIPEGRTWDVVAFKFCYVDLGGKVGLTPTDLLGMYQAALAEVKKTQPGLRIMHVTVPLKSDPAGLKSRLSRWLGRGTANDADNILRNEFNRLLLAEYGKEPFFDLAEAESTLPDGRRTGFRQGDRAYYTLASEYTYDEGHLTAEGKAWVAKAFVRDLAASLRQNTSESKVASP